MPDDSAARLVRGQLPLETRLMPLGSIDIEARTVECVFTTGARVRRYDWASERVFLEELVVTPQAVRLDRLRAGAPVLNTHSQWDLRDVLGVTDDAEVRDAEGRARLRFSGRAEVQPVFQDVVDRILRFVSVGYVRHRIERVPPAKEGELWVYRVVDWEPFEISIVPVPADAGAQIRRGAEAAAAPATRVFDCEFIDSPPPAAAGTSARKEHAMPEAREGVPAADPATLPSSEARAAAAAAEASARRDDALQTPAADAALAAARADGARAEARRQTEIRALGALSATRGLGEAFLTGMVDDPACTVDEARRRILDELGRRSAAQPTRSAAYIESVTDETETRRAAIGEALAHRAGSATELPERARAWRPYSLLELARRALEAQGVRTEGMSRLAVVSMALTGCDEAGFRTLHGTSDFTTALASTVNRSLRRGYESAPRTFTAWARRGTLPDFRAASRVTVSGNLTLEKVNEHGEFKRGKLVDGGETIQLATYGKVVGVTRQVVINDDIDMLGRLPRMFGRAAADFESDTVYAVLTANANMADNVALFHANHGNLGTGGAPSETTFSEMRKLFRLQTDPSGSGKVLNLAPRFVIGPAALETTIQKILQAVIVATKTADTNVFRGSLEMVIDARLDASSATAWYGAGDPEQIDTVEYAYLDGEEGLFTESRNGFDVDGLEVKARLDFAAKAIDHRGLFKNAGA